jgi:hypothetical protein
MGIAVLEDDMLVLNAAFEGTAQRLDVAPDVTGDGRDELVSTGDFGMGGQVSRSMTLTAFGAAGLADLGGATIYDSACAAGGGVSTAARVLAGLGPTFTIEHYSQPCESTTWSAGATESLVFEPTSDVRYVLLRGEDAGIPAGASPAGRRESGRLDASDQTLNSGEYVDEYAVECRRGRSLVLDLRATDFDPYLILQPPAGEQIDNDDHEGDRTHSHIQTTITADGTCRVLVTSYQPGEAGAYELLIRGE